jgi:hypothetical protein
MRAMRPNSPSSPTLIMHLQRHCYRCRER